MTLLLAACPRKDPPQPPELPGDPYPGREQSLRGLLLRELEIEVAESYDIPTFELAVPSTAVSSRVGAVHIGVGPEELAAGVKGSVDRWPLLPLDPDGNPLDEAMSKRLEMHLSDDLTAAWVFDEVSYRFPGCVVHDYETGLDTYKTATVPLRMTAVFIRDGERWVLVLEHLSYPQRIGELVADADKLTGSKLRNGVDPRAKQMEAPIKVLQRAVAVDTTPEERARVFSSDRAALALWPDPEQELRGGAVVEAAGLAAAFDAEKIELESWRIGMSPDPTGGVGGGSIAWAAVTLKLTARRVAGDDIETVPIRLRATFVLERRDVDGAPTWQVVQSHVSAPVSAPALIGTIAPVGGGNRPPWQRACDGT
jgi:hypothetical protein